MSLYTPRHFAMADEQAIRRVLVEHGFATLITSADNEVTVSHVPVLFEPDAGPHGVIVGHVAKANPHADAIAKGTSFLVFLGPSGYVSPNWYASPAVSVPTWNYVAVHVHGRIERLDGLGEKRAIVDELSARHEASFSRPWTTAKMDPALLETMLGAIVGFRIAIERLDAKFKLSQNRAAEDRTGVIAGLESRDLPAAEALAAWMRAYAKP